MQVTEFFNFIKERHAIYQRRLAGQPKPWTQDPILQKFRFCNVFRELDAVTVWISENWRKPNADDPDLWFGMAVARLFNQPATLQAIGYPVPFKAAAVQRKTEQRKAAGELVFNAAYIVSTNGVAMDKCAYVVQWVLTPLWTERKVLRPRSDDTLRSFFQRITQLQGVGSFIGGQIVSDVKFAGPLKKATDWWTFASSGPGSRRGLNRVLGQPAAAPWREENWLAELNLLQTKIDPQARAAGMPRISASDLQNCCCEFDKMCRAKYGEGRPKQLYPGLP
jgi:hypothetical protein